MDILSAIVKQVEPVEADESCLCRIRYFLEDFYSVYMRENEKSIEDYKKKMIAEGNAIDSDFIPNENFYPQAGVDYNPEEFENIFYRLEEFLFLINNAYNPGTSLVEALRKMSRKEVQRNYFEFYHMQRMIDPQDTDQQRMLMSNLINTYLAPKDKHFVTRREYNTLFWYPGNLYHLS